MRAGYVDDSAYALSKARSLTGRGYGARRVADHRAHAARPAVPRDAPAPDGLLADTRGRPLRDLRISVTDRCNFRCSYCMPKEVFDKDYPYLARSDLLSFEEIERIARLFVAHGVNKLRITGGEPLLRKDVDRLIEMLARLPEFEAQGVGFEAIFTKLLASVLQFSSKRLLTALKALIWPILGLVLIAEQPTLEPCA